MHEDEVPDLELLPFLVQAHELFSGQLTSAALAPGTQVDVQLGVRAGWAGIGHLPEIVLVAQAEDPAVRDAGDLPPQLPRFIVGMVHRDIQPVGIDAEPLAARHPFPGVFDRLLLEVIAEGEVAEHLEERVVARGVTHLLEVVVLPAGADALLAGYRARVVAAFQPLKHPLELHHAGVRKEQRGVVRGDERGARHLVVGARGSLEIVDELAADFTGLHAGKI